MSSPRQRPSASPSPRGSEVDDDAASDTSQLTASLRRCATMRSLLAVALCLVLACGAMLVGLFWGRPDTTALTTPTLDTPGRNGGIGPTLKDVRLAHTSTAAAAAAATSTAAASAAAAAASTHTGIHLPSTRWGAYDVLERDPVAWVRQWHLAPPDRLYLPVDHTVPASLPTVPATAEPVPYRCSPEIHRLCSETPKPSAHRVGLANLPSLLIPRIELDQLASIWHDPVRLESMIDSITPPWQLRLTTLATRFDLTSGDFHILLSLDDVVTHLNGTDENQVCHGAIASLQLRRLRVWQHLLATGTKMNCIFNDDTDLPEGTIPRRPSTTTPAKDYTHGTGSEAVELVCAFPGHPRPPPHELNITVEMTFSPAWWPTPPRPARMVVPMRSTLDRRVSVAYCGKPLANTMPLGFIMDFIQHHAMLGIEVFHLYDRYNQPAVRARLLPHIRSGLVQLHQVPEHTHFYTRGVPTEMSIYYSQVAYQEVCRFRNFESASYVAIWDFDEYLSFPQKLRDEDMNLEYATPNGIGVDATRIEQTPPTCMRRNKQSGLLQMAYTHVDNANARADAAAKISHHDLVADTLRSHPLHARTTRCESMVTRLFDALPGLHRQAFHKEKNKGAGRSKLPWFISIMTMFHGEEHERVVEERAAFRAHLPRLLREGRNPQPTFSHIGVRTALPPTFAYAAPNTRTTTAPAGTSPSCAALPHSVAFVTSFLHDRVPAELLSPAGGARPGLNQSELSTHCFMREEFQYSPVLRFPVDDPALPMVPKFLMQTRARAATWVHWPTAARQELKDKSWSLLLRNFHRPAFEAKEHETRVTVHAPPIVELMHFYNIYRGRDPIGAGLTAIPTNTSHIALSADADYRTMMTQLQEMKCVGDDDEEEDQEEEEEGEGEEEEEQEEEEGEEYR